MEGSRGYSGQVLRLVLFPSLKVMSRESKYKAWLPEKTVHLFHECVYCPKHTRKYFWQISFSPSWLSTFLPSQRPLTEVHILSFSQWLLVLTSLHGSSCYWLWKCLNKPALTEEPVPMDYILRETDLDCLSHIIQGLALFEHPRYSPYLTVMNSCLFPKSNSPSKN